VIIKEVFSDLFKLRNAVNLKKKPPQKVKIPGRWEERGPQITL